ncbi:expansin family protein [Niveomyces insectorum RCEF 264]|uniref:Expansin family protein n=1 Tax=Niveomyces insectorum RCEF 264 TaxID=1081102 RepID=A0A162JFH6_9HYPO|nr:expansin family protein [Niveomyces insectorum RCEF 264]
MKTTGLLLVGAAALAVAQPHGYGGHARAHLKLDKNLNKRDVKTEYTTEWATVVVTEYIDLTTTTYATSGSAPTPSAAVPGEFFEGASSSPATPTPASAPHAPDSSPAVNVPASSPVVNVPAAAAAPASSPVVNVPAAAAAPASSPVVNVPAAAAAPASSPVVNVPAAAASPASSPVVNVPAAAASPASSPVVNVPAAAAAPASSPAVNTPADSYTGDMTYYALGLGACGVDNSGQDMSANIVAMNSAQMGAQSNDNPMCGKTITIQANGNTVTATIMDKCPTCAYGDIDVSEAVFDNIFGSTDVGRSQVTWWFN